MDEEVQEEVTSAPDLNNLTKVYLRIRDARDALTAQYKKEYAELEEQLALIESEMLDTCKTMGVESMRTPHGTIIRSVKSRYWTNDWDSMYDFIEEHGAFGLLEKRLHQTNMKEFLEEHPDTRPPGLNIDSEYDITIKRR